MTDRLCSEKHKRARDKILKNTNVYVGDQNERWTKEKQELYMYMWNTRFPRLCPISFPFTCMWPRLKWQEITYCAFLTCKKPYAKHMFKSYPVAWSLRTFVMNFQLVFVFLPATLLPSFLIYCHSKPRVGNIPFIIY